MDTEELMRELRRLKRSLEQLEAEFAHGRTDDGLLHEMDTMLENGLADDTPVPADAVTTSGSGLDPHISIANARLQTRRVADERGLSVDRVEELVDANTDGRTLGFLGQPGVNVLGLNLALDSAS